MASAAMPRIADGGEPCGRAFTASLVVTIFALVVTISGGPIRKV